MGKRQDRMTWLLRRLKEGPVQGAKLFNRKGTYTVLGVVDVQKEGWEKFHAMARGTWQSVHLEAVALRPGLLALVQSEEGGEGDDANADY